MLHFQPDSRLALLSFKMFKFWIIPPSEAGSGMKVGHDWDSLNKMDFKSKYTDKFLKQFSGCFMIYTKIKPKHRSNLLSTIRTLFNPVWWQWPLGPLVLLEHNGRGRAHPSLNFDKLKPNQNSNTQCIFCLRIFPFPY